jgi:hypothetical protein
VAAVRAGEAGRNRSLRDHLSPHDSLVVTTAGPFEAKGMMELLLGQAREIEIRWLRKRGWLEKELAGVEARRKVRGL